MSYKADLSTRALLGKSSYDGGAFAQGFAAFGFVVSVLIERAHIARVETG